MSQQIGRNHTVFPCIKVLLVVFSCLVSTKSTRLKINMEPKVEVWKMIFLFKVVIFGFHVSFQGCTLQNLDL